MLGAQGMGQMPGCSLEEETDWGFTTYGVRHHGECPLRALYTLLRSDLMLNAEARAGGLVECADIYLMSFSAMIDGSRGGMCSN